MEKLKVSFPVQSYDLPPSLLWFIRVSSQEHQPSWKYQDFKEQFQRTIRRLTLPFHFDLSAPTHARVISQKHPTIVQHKSCYLETMKPVSVSCWIKSFSFYILNKNWNLQKTGRLLKPAFSLEVCVNLPGSGWLCRPRQPPPPTSTLPNSPAIVDGHPFKGTLFKATSRAPPQATGHPFTLLWAPLGAHPAITITISLVPCLAPPSNQEAQRDQEFQSATEKNFCKFPGSLGKCVPDVPCNMLGGVGGVCAISSLTE